MGVSGPWPNERPSRAIFFIEFRVRISAERQFGTIPLWDEWRAWGHGVCRSGPRETVGLARAKRRADWWSLEEEGNSWGKDPGGPERVARAKRFRDADAIMPGRWPQARRATKIRESGYAGRQVRAVISVFHMRPTAARRGKRLTWGPWSQVSGLTGRPGPGWNAPDDEIRSE
ncbi:hypothetical protein VTN49DRAFT_6537 [Thermomyces lanuginosus]|uniref:uncharacterized protein n=1 Tax=Thermomyces lanuginosus TaxID=5541 RepID=UPI003743ED4F